MKLHKMSFVYIEQRPTGVGQWFIIGKGHHYDPDGEVYLHSDGIWSTVVVGYDSKGLAEVKLAEMGYREGVIYAVE